MAEIAVTGVTGNLGGMVSRLCKENGIKVRNLARNKEKAEKMGFSDVFKSSYDKSEDTIKSLEGIDVLFMVSGSENPDRVQQHKDFIDSAKTAGVSHIVYLSFYNASKNSIFTLGRDHYATEEYIKENGFKYTFLRDNFYVDFFVDMCREYGEIKGPAGNGKVSAVVRSDVSEVAAKILENPEKGENQTLNMTGPEELTMEEIFSSFFINFISQNFLIIFLITMFPNTQLMKLLYVPTLFQYHLKYPIVHFGQLQYKSKPMNRIPIVQLSKFYGFHKLLPQFH